MEKQRRVKALAALGAELTKYKTPRGEGDKLEAMINLVHHYNGWFTEENVRNAITAWGESLTEEKLNQWLGKYNLPETNNSVKVGIVMAGNIPMVGFHDLLSILVTGNIAVVKFSSDDDRLIPLTLGRLFEIEPAFIEQVLVADGKLTDFDAIIATGSNNTSRYFEHYFGKYPNIIRKNRNSVAVLSGDETTEELVQLGKDIFRYFGLGCRNVSKVYVPNMYSFDGFFKALDVYTDIVNHKKYGNNYDYNKAIYLVNQDPYLDAGFLLMKEDKALASPVSTIHYEYYGNPDDLKSELDGKKEEIQCIVGEGYLPFGSAQEPELWDYADGVDTIEFLLQLQTAKAS